MAVGAIVGAVLAPETGGTSLLPLLPYISAGAAVGATFGSIIDAVTRPKDADTSFSQRGIQDLSITSAALGTVIPIIRGRFTVPGNIIDATKKVAHSVETAVSTGGGGGGKGGSGGPTSATTQTTYSVTLDIALCQGPIERLTKIWMDATLVYDEGQPSTRFALKTYPDTGNKTGGVSSDNCTEIHVFLGTETQGISSVFEHIRGAQDVQAYRGIAHVVIKDLNLGTSGRVPQFNFEIQQSLRVDGTPIRALVTPDAIPVLFDNNSFGEAGRALLGVFSIGDLVVLGSNSDALGSGPVSIQWYYESGIFGAPSVTAVLCGGDGIDSNSDSLSFFYTKNVSYIATTLLRPHTVSVLHFTNSPSLPGVSNQAITRLTGSWITDGVVPGTKVFLVPDNPPGPLGAGAHNGGTFTVDSVSSATTITVLEFVVKEPDSAATPPLDEQQYTMYISSAALTPLSMAGDFHGNLWVVCKRGNTFFEIRGVPALATKIESLPAVPTFCIWSPYGPFGTLYIFLDSGVVRMYHTESTGPVFQESFATLGVVKDRVIVRNHLLELYPYRTVAIVENTNFLIVFNGSSGLYQLTVPAAPQCVIEAHDGWIWVGHNSSTLTKMLPDGTMQANYAVPTAIVSLAPAFVTGVWACGKEADAVYLVRSDGTYTTIHVPRDPVQVTSDAYGNCYVRCRLSRTMFFISADGLITNYQHATGGSIRSVVSEFAVMAGIPQQFIDVSGVDDAPVNILLNNIVSVNTILEGLATSHNFIMIESDGLLKFKKKLIGSSGTIPERLLSAGEDSQTGQSLVVSRVQERELPTKVSVNYPDPARNFQGASQTQQLVHAFLDTDVVFSMNLPIALYADQAQFIAQTLLYEPWTSRENFTFTLSPRYLALEPGDVVEVTSRGFTYSIRIAEWVSGDNWLSEVKGFSYDPSIHTGFHGVPAIGTTGFVGIPQTAQSKAYLFEPPALDASEVQTRYLFAAYSVEVSRAFQGSNLYESFDGGISYGFTLGSSTPSLVGKTLSVLGSTSNPHVWDDVHTVDVILYQGALGQSTDLDVLNGENWVMFSTGEIIGVVSPILIAPQTYRFTRLLRGRKGTESFVGSHSLDEFAVVLTDTLRQRERVLYPLSDIGVTHTYKIADPRISVLRSSPFDYAPNGLSVKPFAPVLFPLLRNTPATNDITIQWVFRSRFFDPPLGVAATWDFDATKNYVVNLYADSNYSGIVHSFTTGPFNVSADTTLSQVYTAAQQATDGFTPGVSTFFYEVYALGTGVNGYPARGSG